MQLYQRLGISEETYRFFLNFYRFVFTDIKMILAINITNRCNLKCTHCYWWRDEHPAQLDEDSMIAFFKRQRDAGKNMALLYGGEPMLRPNIIRAASEIFDATVVYTNGTVSHPGLEAVWMISLDGTREVHDKIRGKGSYDKVIKNIENEVYKRPIIHITITRQNQYNIEAFLDEMNRNSRVQGVGFSFYTPERGKEHKDFLIPLDERDRVLDELLRLRKKYWRIMGFNKGVAHQFKTTGAYTEWNSLSKCTVTKMVDCFNSDGSQIKCIYGDNADCSRCGCTGIAIYRAAFNSFSPMSFLTAMAMVDSQNKSKKNGARLQ